MANEAIEEGLAQHRRRCCSFAQRKPRLLQSEQFEMIDQEGAGEDNQPAEAEERPQDRGADRIGHRPHRCRQLVPE